MCGRRNNSCRTAGFSWQREWGEIRKITRKKVQRGGSKQEKGREPGLKGKGSKKIGLTVRSPPPSHLRDEIGHS